MCTTDLSLLSSLPTDSYVRRNFLQKCETSSCVSLRLQYCGAGVNFNSFESILVRWVDRFRFEIFPIFSFSRLVCPSGVVDPVALT